MRDTAYFGGNRPGDIVGAVALYLRCRRMARSPRRVVAVAVHPLQLADWIARPPRDPRLSAGRAVLPAPRLCGLPIIADPRLPRTAWRPVLRSLG